MYIERIIEKDLEKQLKPGRVLILYGPRQVGKTTLVKKFLENYSGRALFYDGQDINTQELFSTQSIEKYRSQLSGYDLLVIDEAQYIEKIGLNLKIVVDHIPGLAVIATGSFSFELAQKTFESLTGRKRVLTLFPLAQMELDRKENPLQTKAKIEERLVYGGYPEVITAPNFQEKKEALRTLASSYLYKDILQLEGIRYRKKIVDLLKLLAFQIGKEVSINELAANLGINNRTVDRYLDLLEKSFVLINVRGFSRNLRKEITKNSRYYFYDTGVRNTIVNSFNPLGMRNDVGMLWENYIITERLKKQEYKNIYSNNYFWRTYDQKEIDWVEEREGILFGYEIKWSDKKVSAPKDWMETYPNARFKVINKDNYLEFIK